MRQVFSSHRLANVEGVAKLLEDAGIEVRISDGRSYKGAFARNTGYQKHAQSAVRPAVWIVKAEDQPRARQILRDAGLLESSRPDTFLPTRSAERPPSTTRMINRIRWVLFAAVLVMTLWIVLRLLGWV